MVVRPLQALRAAGILSVLAALVFSPEAQAQYPLSDPAEWEHLGAQRQQIAAFGFSGSPDALVVWAGESGIYRLLDTPGGSWERLHIAPFRGPVFMVGSPPDTVFVGNALYRSTDNGESFERLSTLADGEGERIDSKGALSRFPPNSPYPYRLVAGDFPSAFYSDDGGDTWTRTESSPPLEAVVNHAFTSGRVLSAGFYGAVMSDDGARTFQPVPALYEEGQVSFDLRSLVVFPGLVTGQPGDSEEGRVLISGADARRGGMIVWSSDDEGDSWREVRLFSNFCSPGFMMSLVGPEVGGDVGWAVGVDCLSRVYATGDGGESWFPIGEVPLDPDETSRTLAIAVGPDGRLYAGTTRNGPSDSWSWRTREPVADVVRVAVSSAEAPEQTNRSVLTVSPNPSSRTVTVELSGSPGDARLLIVTDTAGREIARHTVVPGAAWHLDVSGWAPGVYHARSGADGETTESVSFTVVR